MPPTVVPVSSGPTAASRLEDLRTVSHTFNTYLCQVPGTQLDTATRLGIVLCARDALLKCEGCRAHLKEQQSDNGKGFFEICNKDISHSPAFPIPPTSSGSSNDDLKRQHSCFQAISHALVNHQSSLTDEWYDDTIQAMMACNLLPAGSKVSQYHSAMIEIILLTVISHSLHMTFLILQEDSVPLPTWKDIAGAPDPYRLDIDAMLTPGHTLRYYSKYMAHAPYISHRDIDYQSSEYQRISPEARAYVPKALAYVLEPSPFLNTLLA